jgi:hypothetical protein
MPGHRATFFRGHDDWPVRHPEHRRIPRRLDAARRSEYSGQRVRRASGIHRRHADLLREERRVQRRPGGHALALSGHRGRRDMDAGAESGNWRLRRLRGQPERPAASDRVTRRWSRGSADGHHAQRWHDLELHVCSRRHDDRERYLSVLEPVGTDDRAWQRQHAAQRVPTADAGRLRSRRPGHRCRGWGRFGRVPEYERRIALATRHRPIAPGTSGTPHIPRPYSAGRKDRSTPVCSTGEVCCSLG